MSKLNQSKILLHTFTYKLVRERDGLVVSGRDVAWIEWNQEGRFDKKHGSPAVGLSLIVDPQRINFTWLTTPITVIVEERDEYVKFKTENSTYELFKY